MESGLPFKKRKYVRENQEQSNEVDEQPSTSGFNQQRTQPVLDEELFNQPSTFN